ncbi:aminotransferase class V-fold PLP-dependent enzyme [Geminicoccus roseus]|uniref:aminotransferase class V-fold PLP-dependent enzyme n=1 Tax=Geminicoccus roseus TaxID=404900 RepID=UPI000425C47F|nr:aminotransferase class V-fold PLP-dependent enzyme [Geminicoccus roseus]
MTSVYARLGVRPVINGKGPATRLSGGRIRPEVLAAMAEAAGSCVDMADLQAAASRRIAQATGAEAGLVTSGAAAGLLLATAACVTGLDPGRMARLPQIAGMPGEVVVARSQRNFYDHAVRTAGVRLVEVGLPDRYAGAGVRDAEPWEFADAIGPDTAAVLWVADAQAQPGLAQLAEVAHAAGVPVIVDAAAQLPPSANLRRFTDEGADLVAFSGGKALGGPQASGILAGRRDLIMAAALQMLDLDVWLEQFRPNPDFIDLSRLRGLPPHGIGRPCKVGKEQIVGLLTALDLFLAEDDRERSQRWLQLLEALQARLAGIAGMATTILPGTVPLLRLDLEREAWPVVMALEGGTPSVRLDVEQHRSGRLVVNPICLGSEELDPLAGRLAAVLG